ncbi:hypothetical protein Hanom_Chr16g01460641 [Helianthus anomalus]
MRGHPISTPRKHDSVIIGKTSPSMQVEPTPPIFALHLDAAKNNEESENRTWVKRNINSFPNHSTTTSLACHDTIKLSHLRF